MAISSPSCPLASRWFDCSSIAPGFFILREQQGRNFKKLSTSFKRKSEQLHKWCGSRECFECSYTDCCFEKKLKQISGACRIQTVFLHKREVYWQVVYILVARLLYLKESVGIILRPTGDYPPLYCPVSFPCYKITFKPVCN